MHSEPDGPFFGEDTGNLRAQPINEPISLDASYSEGPLGQWLEEQWSQDRSKGESGVVRLVPGRFRFRCRL